MAQHSNTDTVEVVADPHPFVQIPAWLIAADVSDRAVRLYAVLATYANNRTGEAWPGRRTLADRLRCSPATAWRATRELVDVGALTVTERTTEAGSQTSNLYRIHWSPPSRRRDTPHRADATPPIAPTRRELHQEELELPPYPPSTNAPEPDAVRRTGPPVDDPPGFGDWYARYPRHTGRRAAVKAYRSALRRGATPESLMAALDGWLPILSAREPRYVPYPSTFLNSGDGDSPPAPDATAAEPPVEVIVGVRCPPAEARDADLTALWWSIEAARARRHTAAGEAELGRLEAQYAEQAAAGLGVDPVDRL